MATLSSPAGIDLLDRKILSALDKNCRASNTQIAKKIRKSREVVAYRIQKLQEQGIITGFITSINPAKLGYLMFKIYLKLENIPLQRERFYHALQRNKDIYWMSTCDGAYDCVLAILSKSVPEYYELINNLLSEWKPLIINRVLGTMVDTKQFTKRYFLSDGEGTYVIFGSRIENNEIDELDSKILSTLANNARIPLLELARTLHSTIEVVRRRIAILEKKEMILQYRLAIDLNKLGLEFFKVFLYCKSLSKSDEASLLEWMRRHPKSLYYIRSLAPWELEFEFAVENYHEFNKIMSDLREQFPHIIRNHEHLIMSSEMWMPAYTQLLSGKKWKK